MTSNSEAKVYTNAKDWWAELSDTDKAHWATQGVREESKEAILDAVQRPWHFIEEAWQAFCKAYALPQGIANFRTLDPSKAPMPKPKAIVISAKMQLWASIKGIDLRDTDAIHQTYNIAKKEQGLANVSYIRLMAENALALAGRVNRRRAKKTDVSS